MSHEADAFWTAALFVPVGYDYWALRTGHETASSAMRRYTEKPWQKFMLCGFMAGLTLHFISQQYDPGRFINFERVDNEPA